MNKLLTHPGFDPAPPWEVTLTGDLIYENDSYIITVKKDYRSDGGSLPRISWTLLGVTPTDSRCIYAFFLHDFLYQSESLTRQQADTILDEVLAIPPCCNSVQRWLIWSHVRAYGWLVWNKHTSESIEEGKKWGKVEEKKKLLSTVIK
jgi:hypothetical protein